MMAKKKLTKTQGTKNFSSNKSKVLSQWHNLRLKKTELRTYQKNKKTELRPFIATATRPPQLTNAISTNTYNTFISRCPWRKKIKLSILFQLLEKVIHHRIQARIIVLYFLKGFWWNLTKGFLGFVERCKWKQLQQHLLDLQLGSVDLQNLLLDRVF